MLKTQMFVGQTGENVLADATRSWSVSTEHIPKFLSYNCKENRQKFRLSQSFFLEDRLSEKTIRDQLPLGGTNEIP